MGYELYSTKNRTYRAESLGYSTKSSSEIFTNTKLNISMDPKNISIRESRDSKSHPNSIAIILALDVTGSMGHIPHYLIKEGLPNIMSKIIQMGIPDPQLLFLGIGDHECDNVPLQVGQFESGDEELDKWLTELFLEGGGGGNKGESYLLSWYFAAFYTSIDCYEKRKQKGFLFTIGDEPVLDDISSIALSKIMGNGDFKDFDALTLLDKASDKYNVYHFHLKQGAHGHNQNVIDGWKQIIGDNLIIIEDKKDVSKIIPEIIKNNIKLLDDFKTITIKNDTDSTIKEEEPIVINSEEIIL